MRQLFRQYLQHGRRHLPTGTDPIPGLSLAKFYPQQQTLPLGLPDQFAPTGADVLVDTTRRNNYKWKFDGTGTATISWPFSMGAGAGNAQQIYINAGAGPAYGTMTGYFAGGYLTIPPAGPSMGEWVEMSTFDFSIDPLSGDPRGGDYYDPYLHTPDHIAWYTSGTYHNWGWDINTAADPGTLSTTIDVSGFVDGGPGYYFFRLDCTNFTDLSEVVIANGIHGAG